MAEIVVNFTFCALGIMGAIVVAFAAYRQYRL